MSFISRTTSRLIKEGKVDSEVCSVLEVYATNDPEPVYILVDKLASPDELPKTFSDPFQAVARWDLLNNIQMRTYHTTQPSYTKVLQ
jgi:hypothetical protein